MVCVCVYRSIYLSFYLCIYIYTWSYVCIVYIIYMYVFCKEMCPYQCCSQAQRGIFWGLNSCQVVLRTTVSGPRFKTKPCQRGRWGTHLWHVRSVTWAPNASGKAGESWELATRFGQQWWGLGENDPATATPSDSSAIITITITTITLTSTIILIRMILFILLTLLIHTPNDDNHGFTNPQLVHWFQ